MTFHMYGEIKRGMQWQILQCIKRRVFIVDGKTGKTIFKAVTGSPTKCLKYQIIVELYLSVNYSRFIKMCIDNSNVGFHGKQVSNLVSEAQSAWGFRYDCSSYEIQKQMSFMRCVKPVLNWANVSSRT